MEELQPTHSGDRAPMRGSKSLAERIWQYKLHYLIVIPALALILVLKIIPFLQGVYLSFRDYSPFMGLQGSPWVGLDNYAELFRSPGYRSALANTLTYKALYIVAGGAAAFVAALALSGIRSGRLRDRIVSVLVVPYVIPSVVLGHFTILTVSVSSSPLLSPDRLLLGEPGSFRVLLLLTELLKYGGIPTVVALAAIAATHAAAHAKDSLSAHAGGNAPAAGAGFGRMNALPAARAVAAMMLLQLSVIVTTDFELLQTLISPLVSQSAGTVDHFVYQLGFMNMSMGPASAAAVISFALQFVLALAAYFIVRGAFLDALFHRHAGHSADLQGGSRIAGGAAAILGAGFVLSVLYFIFVDPFVRPSEVNIPLGDLVPLYNMGLSVVWFGAAAAVSMLVTVTLAYPMTARRLPGGTLYRLFLIGVMCIGTGTVHEYMFFRSLHIVNTIFPVLFVGFVNIVSAFVLKSIFNGKYGHLKERAELEGKGELDSFFTLFLPKIWKPLLALAALQFIALWNSYLPSLIYITNPAQHAGLMNYLNLLNAGAQFGMDRGDPILYRVGALVSLPPLALFLLARKWIVSEVLVGGMLRR